MSRRWFALLVAPVLFAAACSDDSSKSSSATTAGSAAGKQQFQVTLSDAGCEPAEIAAKAGPATFKVTNTGSAAVTEFEILDGTKILGEVENVIPGSDRSFSLTLKPGSFVTYCPNAKVDNGVLTVADAPAAAVGDTASSQAAVKSYLEYVRSEADQLVAAVAPFTAAVKAGDVEGAKNTFAKARFHYEAIEPIAESFGDLDPAIDIREADVAKPDDFTGFHRIEKQLWVDGNTTAMGAVADKLTADIAKLRSKIDAIQLEPSTIANGAVELLNEMSTSKITGEEEEFSHTDLSDLAANLGGSKAAFDSVKTLLDAKDAALSSQITLRFADVQRVLD